MSDRIQITFPIENWKYICNGSIGKDGDGFVYVTTACPHGCSNAAIDCTYSCIHCPYANELEEMRLLEKYHGFEDGSWSHPPARERREHLLPLVEHSLSEHASGVGSWFERVADQPWHEVEREGRLNNSGAPRVGCVADHGFI